MIILTYKTVHSELHRVVRFSDENTEAAHATAHARASEGCTEVFLSRAIERFVLQKNVVSETME